MNSQLLMRFDECTELHGEGDVEDIVELFARFKLVPTKDGATPVADVSNHLTSVHNRGPVFKNPAPGLASDMWILKMLRTDQPQVQTNLYLSRDQLDGAWRLLVSVWIPSHARQGLTLDEFGASWTELLDGLGSALYQRVGPVLGSVLSTTPDARHFNERDITNRRLVIGWRTWFGPGYVETFGPERLLGLPDRTTTLADEGIHHALEADLAQVLRGDGDPYARVWRYLNSSGLRPAWPRAPRAARASRTTIDQQLTDYRRVIVELLSVVIELEGDQHLIVLAPDWTVLEDRRLGRAKRALLLQSVQEAVDRELAEHPNASIRFELDQDAPKELRRLLDHLVNDHSRLSYVVLPGVN